MVESWALLEKRNRMYESRGASRTRVSLSRGLPLCWRKTLTDAVRARGSARTFTFDYRSRPKSSRVARAALANRQTDGRMSEIGAEAARLSRDARSRRSSLDINERTKGFKCPCPIKRDLLPGVRCNATNWIAAAISTARFPRKGEKQERREREREREIKRIASARAICARITRAWLNKTTAGRDTQLMPSPPRGSGEDSNEPRIIINTTIAACPLAG